VLRSDGVGGADELGQGAAREKRYRLLDTLREFGAEQLALAGQQALFLDRLTDHCLALASRFDQRLLDDDQPDQLRQLRAGHPSLQVALAHSLDDRESRRPGRGPASAEQVERWRRGARLAVRLHGYWQMRGLLSEGRSYLDQALRVLPEASLERAWALGVRGRLASIQGDPAGAVADLRESVRLAEESGQELAAARGYLYLNLALGFAGEHQQAVAAGLTARQRMTACDDRIGLALLEPQLALLHQLAGNVDAALDCCRRGQAKLGDFSPRGGERWISSQLQLVSGLALFQRPGFDAECVAAIRRALLAKHDLGDEVGMAYCLEVLGWLAARGSRYDQAASLLSASAPVWRRAGSPLSSVAFMQQIHQRVSQQAREALGDAGYEIAQGGALDLDAVVACALDERAVDDRAVDDRSVDERAVDERRPASGPSARPATASASATDGGGPRYAEASDGGPGDGGPGAPVAAAALTRREREIAILVASGLSNREIASRLYISKRTVDAHVEHIFAKLEISSRVKLTLWLRSQVRMGA